MADPRDDDEFAGYAGGGANPFASDNGERSGDEDGRGADVSGWYERTPSGWRDRVDPDLALKIAEREKAKQRIDQTTRRIASFAGCQFVAHVSDKMTFNKHGDLIVQLIVPFQFKDMAVPLSDAFGLPLHIDVQLWEPFDRRIREQLGQTGSD